jgi:hypothetical protein
MSMQGTQAPETVFRRKAWEWLARAPRGNGAPVETQAAAEATASTDGSAAQPAATAPTGSSLIRDHLGGVLEALLFASDKPMTVGELAKAAKAEKKLVKRSLRT